MEVSLQEVVNGLRGGYAYWRALEDDGNEYLSPAGEGQFCHEVAGGAHGGCGGSSVMPMNTLLNGRWPEEGWRVLT